MSAQRAYKQRSAPWRNDAIKSVMANWRKISPDGDREERLAWISEFLGHEVTSLTDLTDDQLGAVAGEMKRLTGHASPQTGCDQDPCDCEHEFAWHFEKDALPSGRTGCGHPKCECFKFKSKNHVEGQRSGNVVPIGANIHRSSHDESKWSSSAKPTGDGVAFLATREQVFTLTKLQQHLGWNNESVAGFIRERMRILNHASFRLLTFAQATAATNALLHVAAHRDLKKRSAGKPVSRAAVNKYIPILKAELKIDQTR